jgi:hypothetical protein
VRSTVCGCRRQCPPMCTPPKRDSMTFSP